MWLNPEVTDQRGAHIYNREWCGRAGPNLLAIPGTKDEYRHARLQLRRATFVEPASAPLAPLSSATCGIGEVMNQDEFSAMLVGCLGEGVAQRIVCKQLLYDVEPGRFDIVIVNGVDKAVPCVEATAFGPKAPAARRQNTTRPSEGDVADDMLADMLHEQRADRNAKRRRAANAQALGARHFVEVPAYGPEDEVHDILELALQDDAHATAGDDDDNLGALMREGGEHAEEEEKREHELEDEGALAVVSPPIDGQQGNSAIAASSTSSGVAPGVNNEQALGQEVDIDVVMAACGLAQEHRGVVDIASGRVIGVIHNIHESIKATCRQHPGKCVLWVNTKIASPLPVLADAYKWLAAGRDATKEEHEAAARDIKLSYGMRIRRK